jgi:uncharacterized repeat protein (TIGR03987 family)
MAQMIIEAVIFIILALVFYSLGVWTEHKAKTLKPAHILLFWLGLSMDAAGTGMMSRLAGGNDGILAQLHSITGTAAILLMLIHAIWATVVLVASDRNAIRIFHKFSLLVWYIWLVPFILGMILGLFR